MSRRGYAELDPDTKSKHVHNNLQQRNSAFITALHLENYSEIFKTEISFLPQ